jgi:deazaflavin-dependent oxidoreductase (nitroreductase family)
MRNLINRIDNIFIKPLLRSPLHGLVSGQLMLIKVTGRKSGKIYVTPVAYSREGNTITAFTRKERKWWRNLQGGAPVVVRVRGRDLCGDAQVYTQKTRDIEPAMKAFYPRMSPAYVAGCSRHRHGLNSIGGVRPDSGGVSANCRPLSA